MTGLGAVTPLGANVRLSWRNLVLGKTGMVSTGTLGSLYEQIPSKVVGKVPELEMYNRELELESGDFFELKNSRKLPRVSQYAIQAAGELLQDLNWAPELEKDQLNTGVCIGSGVGSIEDFYANAVLFHEGGYRKVQPLFVPRLLNNMPCGNVAIEYKLKGPIHSVSTLCATGANSIGDAFRFIKDGYCDVMVAGATEAPLHPLLLAGFARAKSLVTSFNETPELASRPFDRDRNGFVLGEGAGMIVLEEMEHLLARGAPIYCEIKGYGLSGDLFHITTPPESGEGARRSMESALRSGGVQPEEINYVNAHATSTKLGDWAESEALKSLFDTKSDAHSEAQSTSHTDNPDSGARTTHSDTDNAHAISPDDTNRHDSGITNATGAIVTSTKSATGHALGAAGATELIFTILAVRHDTVPLNLNLHHLDVAESNLQYITDVAHTKINAAMTNSFGFGGKNASLVFAKYNK